MGFLKRKIFKEEKSYNIAEALNILEVLKEKGKIDNYTLEPDENGKYRFISLETSKAKEKKMRQDTEMKRAFYERVNGNGEYKDITINPNGNDMKYSTTQSIVR